MAWYYLRTTDAINRVPTGKLGGTRSSFWQLSAASCSAVLSCYTSMLVVRILGPGAFGSYTLVLWLATVMIPAIGIGTSTLTSRYLAEIQSREEPRLAVGIFYFVWQRQFRRICLYCLLYLLFVFPCAWFFGLRTPLLLLLLAGLSAPPLLLSSVASVTLRSLRRYDLLAVIHLFGTITTLLLVLVVTQVRGRQIELLVLALAIAGVFTLVAALICIVCLLPMLHILPLGSSLKGRLTRGLNNSLLLFALDAIVWQHSELIPLAHWRSAAELGFYALASMLSTWIMEIPPTLLSMCILPLLLRYLPGQRYTSAIDAFVKTSRYMTLLTVPICLCMILFCPTIINYCFGPAYLPAVMPLRILLVSVAFGSISTVSLTHLVNADRKQAQMWLGLGAALVNIVLVIPCIVLWGITGAALASTLARIVSAIGSIIICQRLMAVPHRGTMSYENLASS